MVRSTRRLLPLALLALAGCSGGEDEPGAPAGLLFPVEGALYVDFFYVSLVDHAAPGSVEDYQCGEKTYDGHTGTDIALPSFERMDAGVTVLAAAPGTVVESHDGEFDRNTSWAGQSGLGNYVAIEHADGFVTWYGHMMNGSVAVGAGDDVAAGEPIGLVGSSGRSDLPHLHLELQRDGTVVDPFAGPCGPANSRWSEQDGYDLSFQVVDAGLTNVALDLATVKQPPTPVASFTNQGEMVWFWVLVLNVDAGGTSEFAFYRPDGSLFDTVSIPHTEYYAASWWWANYPAADLATPGTWRVDYRYDGSVWTSAEFDVLAAVSGSDPLADLEPGVGGAGL